jgi:hypothetical protein
VQDRIGVAQVVLQAGHVDGDVGTPEERKVVMAAALVDAVRQLRCGPA